MTLLDRYIARTVLLLCLVVLCLIVGLDTLFVLIAELDDVDERYTLAMAVRYALLTMPRHFYEYAPMAALVGALVGLGNLASSSELTVMRAAGVGKLRILLAVLQPVLLLVLVCGLVGEFVMPKTEQLAAADRAQAVGGGRAIGSRFGFWHRDGNWFLHITAVRPGGQLRGVTIYELDDDRRLVSASFAQRADHEGDHWMLRGLRVTHFEADRTRTETLAERRWKSDLSPELLEIVAAEPEAMSIRGLYHYSQYMQAQAVNATPYKLAFWNKVLLPLAVVGLVLVAISFIFGPLRSVTMGQRIMVGLMVGLTFKLIQDLLAPASTVYGFTPLVAALTPIGVCYLMGGWFLSRGR